MLTNEHRRKECRFVLKRTLMRDEDGHMRTYPDIALVDDTTDLPICYTGLEFFAASANDILTWSETYLTKRLYSIVVFLNYLLHHTDISKISEVDIETIRDFNIWYKTKEDGTSRAPNTWNECLKTVYHFLNRYYFQYSPNIAFSYNPGDLYLTLRPDQIPQKGTTTVVVNKQGVSAPRKGRKKNRVIYGEHLEMLFYCAEKYDPMLLFPLRLEASGGLREGEPVNLTRNSVKIIRKGLIGVAESEIEIDLTQNASFMLNRKGVTPTGSIKKPRTQKVYPDFVNSVIATYEKHLAVLDALCLKKRRKLGRDEDEPLLLNNKGEPMSVDSYSGRVRALFYDHFLPELKAYCSKTGTWEENLPYIEQYEKEYPGLHMCRHWFTMYLITHTNLREEEIAWWRGDRSIESYHDYLHDTTDMQAAFRTCTFAFHKHLWEGNT